MEQQDQGQPIPILKVDEAGKVELDLEKLSAILQQPELEDKRICIVSIAGAFRKGKSFMLNFFLRYLRNKGYENPEWLGEDDVPLDVGFHWQGGKDGCTKGILMWSKYFVSQNGNEKVAVFLMDTQGLFDHEGDTKTDALIFALSTLISSVQIYNISERIQENYLEILQFFTSYAQASKDELSVLGGLKPFQTLVFLVRDWPHPEDNFYGLEGGKEYVKEVLTVRKNTKETNRCTREYLRSTFNDVKCCLLPRPGDEVATKKSFNGCLKDIEPEFVRQLDPFISDLLHPKNLVIKKINREPVSSRSLLLYITACNNVMKSGNLPEPQLLVESTAQVQNLEAQRKCHEGYISIMNEKLEQSFVEEPTLKEIHKEATSTVLQQFKEKTRFGPDEMRTECKEHLERTIQREFETIKMKNDQEKNKAKCAIEDVVENLTDIYKKNMKKETSSDSPLEEAPLHEKHEEFKAEVVTNFSEDENAHSLLKDEYFAILEDKISCVFEDVKKENQEKRSVEQEQNRVKRKLRKKVMKYVNKYKEGLETKMELKDYFEDSQLREVHDDSRQSTIDQFKTEAEIEELTEAGGGFEEQKEILERKLDNEFKKFEDSNARKKNNLKERLEHTRNGMKLKYRNKFEKELKNAYMYEDELKEKHDRIVLEIMNSERATIGTKTLDYPIYSEHLEKAENQLNTEYFCIKKINEENRKFYHGISKFFDKYGSKILAVIGVAAPVAMALAKKL